MQNRGVGAPDQGAGGAARAGRRGEGPHQQPQRNSPHPRTTAHRNHREEEKRSGNAAEDRARGGDDGDSDQHFRELAAGGGPQDSEVKEVPGQVRGAEGGDGGAARGARQREEGPRGAAGRAHRRAAQAAARGRLLRARRGQACRLESQVSIRLWKIISTLLFTIL